MHDCPETGKPLSLAVCLSRLACSVPHVTNAMADIARSLFILFPSTYGWSSSVVSAGAPGGSAQGVRTGNVQTSRKPTNVIARTLWCRVHLPAVQTLLSVSCGFQSWCWTNHHSPDNELLHEIPSTASWWMTVICKLVTAGLSICAAHQVGISANRTESRIGISNTADRRETGKGKTRQSQRKQKWGEIEYGGFAPAQFMAT